MNLWRKLMKFIRMSTGMQLLILEAFLYLAWARILKAIPFSRVAPSLGVQMEETQPAHDPRDEAVIRSISKAVRIAARHTLWESKCLVMAIAGMKMLQRRGIESTLYLGTARDPSAGKMIAHAWLRSGRIYLTGFELMHQFTVVGKFARYTAPNKLQRSAQNG